MYLKLIDFARLVSQPVSSKISVPHPRTSTGVRDPTQPHSALKLSY